MKRNPAKQACTIEGCAKPAPQRGLCGAHYQRWRKYGDPLGLAPKRQSLPVRSVAQWDPRTIDRFWGNVQTDDGCWGWKAAVTRQGYGAIRVDNSLRLAHRVSYELAYGPIPEGKHIDHRCGTRSCTNPAHLRLATPKQNVENLTVLRVDNTSGYRGVTKVGERWIAQVSHFGQHYHVGSFSTPAEAGRAAARKRNELFTHNDADRLAA